LKKDDMRKLNGKPKTHGLSKSNIYWRWNCMIQRCQNQNNSSFYLYGARGFGVDYGKLKYRIKTGMGAERAIFEP
jgi:hypothetical protein